MVTVKERERKLYLGAFGMTKETKKKQERKG
jgi:hypothetical protein